MVRLAVREPQRLWPDSKYDMHSIASGLPVDCRFGEDYTCSNTSFVAGIRRFSLLHDVVQRSRPLLEDGVQVGWRVQFFWNLYRSEGHRTPNDFRHPDGDDDVLAACSPYVRPKYAEIPVDRRARLSF